MCVTQLWSRVNTCVSPKALVSKKDCLSIIMRWHEKRKHEQRNGYSFGFNKFDCVCVGVGIIFCFSAVVNPSLFLKC